MLWMNDEKKKKRKGRYYNYSVHKRWVRSWVWTKAFDTWNVFGINDRSFERSTVRFDSDKRGEKSLCHREFQSKTKHKQRALHFELTVIKDGPENLASPPTHPFWICFYLYFILMYFLSSTFSLSYFCCWKLGISPLWDKSRFYYLIWYLLTMNRI